MANCVAEDFQKIISDARERRRNEALADKIFGCPRRKNEPSKLRQAPRDSLASRTGVSKKRAFLPSRRPSAQASNPDVNWNQNNQDLIIDQPDGHSSARRTLSRPDVARKGPSAQRISRLKTAMENVLTDQDEQARPTRARATGMTIRGLAGPFCVVGENFAPGTSEADIESAMKPVGGEMISCRIVETDPLVKAEMVFTAREGGERVIKTFHNKTADGRILQVYAKNAGSQLPSALDGPRLSRNLVQDQVVDGYMGFPDDLVVTNSYANSSRPLYSDKILFPGRQKRIFHRN